MELSFVLLAATQFRDFWLPIWYFKMKDYNTQACSFTCYIVCVRIEKNEMGGACGTYGAGERGVQGSGGET